MCIYAALLACFLDGNSHLRHGRDPGMGNGHVVGMDWCDEAGDVWLLVPGMVGGTAFAFWWAEIVKIEMIFYVQFD